MCCGRVCRISSRSVALTFWSTEECDLGAHRADNGVLCSAKGAGYWGGLCMHDNGSEEVNLSPLYQ